MSLLKENIQVEVSHELFYLNTGLGTKCLGFLGFRSRVLSSCSRQILITFTPRSSWSPPGQIC
jgi:hypothetical protein